MTLSEFYQAAIRVGVEADPRGQEAVRGHLDKLIDEYQDMPDDKKRLFDAERLTNPFGDTRIVAGGPDTQLNRVMIGIDIDGAELLLAAELTRRGRPVDAVVAHHGSAIAGGIASRHDTAIPQLTMAARAGVPEPRAWKLLQEVIGKEGGSWNLRILQIAQALETALLTVHSPADACLDELVRTLVQRERPETVEDLRRLIEAWPECQWLIDIARHAPTVDAGDAKAPLGKVYRCLYGGWNPTPELFEELCKAGVGTFVVVASTPKFRELAGQYGASIIVIPHYPADNAGINIMLDRIMPGGDQFEFVEISNFRRCRRAKRDRPGNT